MILALEIFFKGYKHEVCKKNINNKKKELWTTYTHHGHIPLPLNSAQEQESSVEVRQQEIKAISIIFLTTIDMYSVQLIKRPKTIHVLNADNIPVQEFDMKRRKRPEKAMSLSH